MKNSPAKKNEIEAIISSIFDNKKMQKVETKETEEETKNIDEVGKKWDMNEKIIGMFVKNIEKDQDLKGVYAKILIGILIIFLIALIIIFVLQGMNILNYSEVTFNIFVTGGIAEVFLLVRIIVKYLFNDNLTELLKIILRANNKSDNIKFKKDSKLKK